jgi:hypothetical protein
MMPETYSEIAHAQNSLSLPHVCVYICVCIEKEREIKANVAKCYLVKRNLRVYCTAFSLFCRF